MKTDLVVLSGKCRGLKHTCRKRYLGGEEVSRVWPGQDQTSNYLLSVCQHWYHNVLHLMAWNSRHRLNCNTDHIGMECCMNFLTFRDTAHCQVNEEIGLLLWVFLNMALRYQRYRLTAKIWTKQAYIELSTIGLISMSEPMVLSTIIRNWTWCVYSYNINNNISQ